MSSSEPGVVDAARSIVASLTKTYNERGLFTGGVVPLASLRAAVACSGFDQALDWLVHEDLLLRSSTGRVALNPVVRLRSLTPPVLWRWATIVDQARDQDERSRIVALVRDELVAVAGYALGQGEGLPPDLDVRLAEVCAILALRDFDCDAGMMSTRHGGDPQQRARVLFARVRDPLVSQEALMALLAGSVPRAPVPARAWTGLSRSTPVGVAVDVAVRPGQREAPAAPALRGRLTQVRPAGRRCGCGQPGCRH